MLRSPRIILALGFGVATVVGVSSYVLTRRKPTAEEIERDRRQYLAAGGRITDGSITETQWLTSVTPSTNDTDSVSPSAISFETPAILVYRYVIAGVTYECAQDVSTLAEFVQHVRVDLPIQVRFDPRNPGNSIVVAEDWTGLRQTASQPHDFQTHQEQRTEQRPDQHTPA
ncbi:MAG: hypothetical protein JWM43_2759 [Acidobacteriaceae bacterium]|nr:hypothetical protein [Acidobacteriaceae bacterium]